MVYILVSNGVINDRDTTVVESTQQLALWYKGPFDSRPNDSIGFGLANYVVNDRVTDKQIATNKGRGYYSYDALASDYVPIQHDELNVELNYTYQSVSCGYAQTQPAIYLSTFWGERSG